MEKVRLGKSGLMVSHIAFGGIPIQRLTEQDAVAVVRKCLDYGINYIDTANRYTNSEERIGKAIAGRSEGLILASKAGMLQADIIPKHLALSLQRLGVSSLDLYQFHGVNTFEDYELVIKNLYEVFERARDAGKIKHIGITSHQPDVAKEAVKSGKFETLMFQFNVVNHEAADDLLPLCKQYDVGFIAMKSLAGGMLDNARLAVKFLLQYPDVVPLIGIQKIEEIDEIMRVVNGSWKISAAEKKEMDRMRKELGNRFCRRCDYCQPCTQGIPISTITITPAIFKSNSPDKIFTGQFTAAYEKAASCIKCGECEKRCPYHLPIREMMEQYVRFYQQEKQKYLQSIAAK